MTYFYLVENGVVTQKQLDFAEGFIEGDNPNVVCGWTYDGSKFAEPTLPSPVHTLPVPIVFGVASLTVSNKKVDLITNAAGIAFAYMSETGVMYVFLMEDQTSYVPFVQAPGLNANVTEQASSYFVVSTDLAGTPTDPNFVYTQLLKV